MGALWADIPRIFFVLLTLLLLSIGYDQLVRWMEKKGYDEGLTAFQVAVGTAYTVLLSSFVIGWEAALFVVLCFLFSGSPMIFGATWRYIKKRQRLQLYQKQVRNGDQT